MKNYRYDIGADDIYYRVGLKNGQIVICCLQWFDEPDYDESMWITDQKFFGAYFSDGVSEHWVEGEEIAKEWLREQGERDDIPEKIRKAINNMQDEMYTNCLD